MRDEGVKAMVTSLLWVGTVKLRMHTGPYGLTVVA